MLLMKYFPIALLTYGNVANSVGNTGKESEHLPKNETPPVVLHPILGHPKYKRHGSVEVNPEEAMKMFREAICNIF